MGTDNFEDRSRLKCGESTTMKHINILHKTIEEDTENSIRYVVRHKS